MERQPLAKFKELELLILRMGYSKETAEKVIALLEAQSMANHFDSDLETVLQEVEAFVKKCLKPAYVARAINQPLALIDIVAEARENCVYLIKHLFHPLYRDGRIRVPYACIEQTGAKRYNLAYRKNGKYEISHYQISLDEALQILEAHPLYMP